jgi:hypothetical protein
MYIEVGPLRSEDILVAINEALAREGLPSHEEPSERQTWSAGMPYSYLHHLRCLAAHVDCAQEPPPPDDERGADDTLLKDYVLTAAGLDASPYPFRFGFKHLICHPDNAGYYLPRDFPQVIGWPDGGISPILGSAARLLAECENLARFLGIPDDLPPVSQALIDIIWAQGDACERWQRYRIESYSCVVLQTACRHSLQWGAALSFT